jgi:hypothetical protein
MIGSQPPSKIWGLWVRKNKTFYWLETGPTHLQFGTDKLRGVLMSREILSYSVRGKTFKGEEPYLDMNLETAQEKEYKIERIFINDHVASIITTEEKTKVKTSKNPWG